MKVTIDLSDDEIKLLTHDLVNYVDLNVDSVCCDDDHKSWQADKDVASSIRDKVVAATAK